MSKYVRTNLDQLYKNETTALSALNKNFRDIESAINDSVSRSAATPTHMIADLDMNGKRIINMPAPATDNDLVRRVDVVGDITLVQNLVNATTNAAAQTLQAAQEVQEIIQDRNVGLVADDLALGENSKIKLCGENLEDITSVADNISNIATVSSIEESIEAVGSISSDVTSVASNSSNINTVASNISGVNTTATNISSVNSVATNITNINAVNSNETNINAVNANKENIDACAADLPNINAKANVSLSNLDSTGEAKFTAKLDANKIQQVSSLPAEPVAGTLYLIPE